MPYKLLIIAVSINTAIGQLLLKKGVVSLGGRSALNDLPQFLAAAARSPWIYLAVAVQGIGYILWMIVISRVKLGVASATAGAAFYLLMALSAWLFFGESLQAIQWLGICLITAGVLCISLVGA